MLRRGSVRHLHWGAVTVACVVAYGLCVAAAADRGLDVPTAIWSLADVPDVLVEFGALAPAYVWIDDEWFRVLTAGVLHGSLLHLVVNLWSLWSIAPFLDRAVGRLWSFAIFVAGIVAGSLASMAFGRAGVVVGASAGIVAQAGALWIVRRFGPPDVQRAVIMVSARALAVSLVILVAVGWVVPVIAQAGHLGGLAEGCLVALAYVRARPRRRGRAAAAVASVVLVALAGFAYAPVWSVGYHEATGIRALERGEIDRARAAFDRALRLAPDDPRLANAVAYALALEGVELARAEELVRGALEREPNNADYWDTLGWVLCRAGRAEEGIEALERARRLADPVFEELLDHLRTCEDVAVSSPP
ncbi:MAG: rhomboid family intramembrane serine protease [Deltaproteobacteria bacterium]|nr:MAG: rhomboid family intramembrane serine protease [Deltaproteobacteria bacterium]